MKAIITGGAGFIGSNAASRYLRRGWNVVVVDNLSRPRTDRNCDWLREQGQLCLIKADIRDAGHVKNIFQDHADANLIFHLAGQVAVTSSVTDPRTDFDSNALGTFNVLEATRQAGITAPLIYSSTNKVYGAMEDLNIVEKDGRYAYRDLENGVSEERNLDFHSPYGCSKGAADQYVRDYSRIFGLKTVVFRQSCIYGYRQFGVEDQGWVAWFTIAAQLGRAITVYGDGKQVRDILFIDDLLDAFDRASERIDVAAGKVYNVGGGPRNVLSLLELLNYLERKRGEAVPYTFSSTRPGDQKIFVADIRLASQELGWAPKTSCQQGLELLYNWIAENINLFE